MEPISSPSPARAGSGAAPLAFDAVRLGYGAHVVLDRVSFAVEANDYLGIVGPNGAGKTTLLRAILGTLRPLAGTIRRQDPLRLGYVPQRNALDPLFPLTVRDVVSMGRYGRLGVWRWFGAGDRRAVREALEAVEMGPFAPRPFRELSGGQKQRVLLARALAAEPDLLLLDEPTGGMDVSAEADAFALVDRVHASGVSVLLVSHDLSAVARHARRLALLHDGEVTVGERDEILREETLERIYRREVTIARAHGRAFVYVGDRRARPGAAPRQEATR